MTEKNIPFYVPFASGVDLYPAGANAWNAEPNKLLSNARDVGFTPGEQVACEFLNSELNTIGTQTAALMHTALREWTALVPNGATSPNYPLGLAPTGIDGSGDPILNWNALNCFDIGEIPTQSPFTADTPYMVTNQADNKYLYSSEGSNWIALAGPGVGSGQIQFDDTKTFPLSFAGVLGVPFVGGNLQGKVAHINGTDLATWSIVDTGLTHITALTSVPRTGSTGGRRIIAGGYGDNTAGQLAYSDDLGVSWTKFGLSTFAQSIGRSVVHFCFSRDGTKIVASTLGNAAFDFANIAVSSDSGSSWTVVKIDDLEVPVNVVDAALGLTYNDTWGMFMAVGKEQFAVSVNGLTWTRYVAAFGSLPLPSTANGIGVTATGRHVCSIGPAICVLSKPQVYQSFCDSGIHYTFDLGKTWNFASIGPITEVTSGTTFYKAAPLGIKNIGGRLFAWGTGTIYRSRSVLLPDPDLRYVAG